MRSSIAILTAAFLLAGNADARSLEDIRSSGYLSICAAPEELPFSAREPAPRGLYIDLATRLATELGLTLKVDWVHSREQVRFTSCDAMMGSALLEDDDAPPADPAALHRTLLSLPYMTARFVMVADRKIGPVASLHDLRPYHVAVPSASVAHKMLNDNNVPVWVRFRTDDEILAAVARGDAEAGVVTNLAAGWYRKQHAAEQLQVFPDILDQKELGFQVGIGLRNTNLATLSQVNAALGKLIADGSVKTILAGYGASDAAR